MSKMLETTSMEKAKSILEIGRVMRRAVIVYSIQLPNSMSMNTGYWTNMQQGCTLWR